MAELLVRRTLVTPEGVDLSLALATRGARAAAFTIDLLIMVGILLALTILAAIAFVSTGGAGGEIIGAIWLLGFFLLRNFWFILFELGARAATPGKRVNGLRVVARSGGRLTADAVIARNLMREIEVYLPLTFLAVGAAQSGLGAAMVLAGLAWTSLFLFFPMFNKDGLRIGDLLAGTWVISVPKRKLGDELLEAAAPDHAFTAEQLDAYGIYELQTLEQVLRDSDADKLAAVSWTIRGKLGIGEIASDREFLSAYYAALRARLERKLLFGKRRKDKFDAA